MRERSEREREAGEGKVGHERARQGGTGSKKPAISVLPALTQLFHHIHTLPAPSTSTSTPCQHALVPKQYATHPKPHDTPAWHKTQTQRLSWSLRHGRHDTGRGPLPALTCLSLLLSLPRRTHTHADTHGHALR